MDRMAASGLRLTSAILYGINSTTSENLRQSMETVTDVLGLCVTDVRVIPSQTLKYTQRGAELLVGTGMAADHVAAVTIADKRIATHAIAQAEPALEIHRPDVVRTFRLGKLSGCGAVDPRFAPVSCDSAHDASESIRSCFGQGVCSTPCFFKRHILQRGPQVRVQSAFLALSAFTMASSVLPL